MANEGTPVVRDTGRAAAGLFMAVAVIVATFLAAGSWKRVKTRPPDRTIQVTGSAKKRIVSDQIEWSAEIATTGQDRTAAYQALAGHMKTALAYLSAQGVKADDVRVGPASVGEQRDTEYAGAGAERVQRRVFRGFRTSQDVAVRPRRRARTTSPPRPAASTASRAPGSRSASGTATAGRSPCTRCVSSARPLEPTWRPSPTCSTTRPCARRPAKGGPATASASSTGAGGAWARSWRSSTSPPPASRPRSRGSTSAR
ncbi:MAG: SIMPL domain-containing protein [Deltaproteobacteria bacterium]|nr:SIMPL domain-containing protein [Deltaproteobacteria bacterium]